MKTVAVQFADAVPDAFQGDGVAFLQTVYKDPTVSLAVRLDAAAKAARFERPMLSASNVRVIRSIEDLTEEELAAIVARGDPDAPGDGDGAPDGEAVH